MPRIRDIFLKSIFYIYPSRDEAIQGNIDSATGFFFCIPSEKITGASYIYAVTNWHIISHSEMEKPVLRINTEEGKFDLIETERDQWKFHPLGSDIAISQIDVNDEHDFSCFYPEFLLTKEFMVEKNIGVGDDVFMVGNFQTRGGRKRNTPTTRFGNISQMPYEPMENPYTRLDEESFVVEMRSISGFSGSPVILSISALFPRFNEPQRKKGEIVSHDPHDYYRLLGIDWGHLRIKERLYDKDGNIQPDRESIFINSAMAGVVPSWKLNEMLFCEEEIEYRRSEDEKYSEDKI